MQKIIKTYRRFKYQHVTYLPGVSIALKVFHLFSVSAISTQFVYAGAFSLYTEGSAVSVGNFAAGVAAECADASIGWYNPAGLVMIKEQQAVLSGAWVFPRTSMTGKSIFTTEDFDEPYTEMFRGLKSANNATVPALHYVKPLGSRAAFGFNIVSPFGLSTNWGDTSPVRYSGTFTQLLTVNASPEIAGFITDHWSWGTGIDFQWAKVTFDGMIGSPAALQFLESSGGEVTPTTLDSASNNEGTSFGIGYHTGILGMFNDNHTRIGLNYQSSIAHEFTGTSTLIGRLADPELLNPNARYSSSLLMSNQIELPDVLTLSGYQDVTQKWALLGSVVYTGWNTFKTIQLDNVAAYSLDLSEQSLEQVISQEDYREAWRFAVGTNYHMTDRWMMRLGWGYDQTPTTDAQRNIRLPDTDRWALAIGTHFQVRPDIGFDLGYSYIWAAQHALINKTQALGPTSANTIQAIANSHVNLAAAQIVWNIDADLKH